MQKINIGNKVKSKITGQIYEVVGVSTMIYDDDCEGEPEWKITHELQEIAITETFNKDKFIFRKPCWVLVADFQIVED